MKSTGIVRRVDDLGRVVIPKEIRRTFEIGENTPLEIFTNGDTVILRKYQQGCAICGETEHSKLLEVKGKYICTDCLDVATK